MAHGDPPLLKVPSAFSMLGSRAGSKIVPASVPCHSGSGWTLQQGQVSYEACRRATNGSIERPIRERMNGLDWERELERLHPASFRWALACCSGDREEAREVLQTVYMKVLDGRARFDGEASQRTWLFSVIRRTAAGRRRAGLVRRVLLGRWALRRPDPTAVPGELELRRELFPPDLVMRHQGEIGLSEEQRTALVHEMQGLQSDLVPLQFDMS